MNINNWINYNGSEYTINGKTYRNLEAQVLENMNKVETFDSRITNNEQSIEALTETVGGHTEQIGDIQENIDDIEGSVVTINDDIDDLQEQYGSLDTFLKDTVTLVDGEWDANNQQTVTVSNLLATDTVWVTPNTSIDGAMNAYLYTQAGIVCIGGDDEELTFQAVYPDELPPADINVDVIFTHVVADVVIPDQSDLFFCTKDVTTYAEITSALQNGKLPVLFEDNAKRFFKYQLQYSNRYYFAFIAPGAGCQQIYVDDYNDWSDLITVSYLNSSQKVTTIDSDSTDSQIPTAKCVYDAIQNITPPSNTIVFDATRGMGSIALDNSKTMQDIVDAYDDGNNAVYVRIRGIADTNQYVTYRVVCAYNLMLDNTKCTIFTEAVPLSVGSNVGAEMLYYPALSATGNIFQGRNITW